MTPHTHTAKPLVRQRLPICDLCGDDMDPRRAALIGRWICMTCGESMARKVAHCIVPLPKSNYVLITDPSLLKGLNSSHRGNR